MRDTRDPQELGIAIKQFQMYYRAGVLEAADHVLRGNPIKSEAMLAVAEPLGYADYGPSQNGAQAVSDPPHRLCSCSMGIVSNECPWHGV